MDFPETRSAWPEAQPLLFTTTYPTQLWTKMFGKTRDGTLVRLVGRGVSAYGELLWEFCGDPEKRTLITTMTGRDPTQGDRLYNITEWEIVNPDETDAYFKIGNGVAVFVYKKDGMRIEITGYGASKERAIYYIGDLRRQWSE